MAIFLSAARSGQLVDELRAGGYADDTPVVVAYKVTWPDELILHTTIGELAEHREAAQALAAHAFPGGQGVARPGHPVAPVQRRSLPHLPQGRPGGPAGTAGRSAPRTPSSGRRGGERIAHQSGRIAAAHQPQRLGGRPGRAPASDGAAEAGPAPWSVGGRMVGRARLAGDGTVGGSQWPAGEAGGCPGGARAGGPGDARAGAGEPEPRKPTLAVVPPPEPATAEPEPTTPEHTPPEPTTPEHTPPENAESTKPKPAAAAGRRWFPEGRGQARQWPSGRWSGTAGQAC